MHKVSPGGQGGGTITCYRCGKGTHGPAQCPFTKVGAIIVARLIGKITYSLTFIALSNEISSSSQMATPFTNQALYAKLNNRVLSLKGQHLSPSESFVKKMKGKRKPNQIAASSLKLAGIGEDNTGDVNFFLEDMSGTKWETTVEKVRKCLSQ